MKDLNKEIQFIKREQIITSITNFIGRLGIILALCSIIVITFPVEMPLKNIWLIRLIVFSILLWITSPFACLFSRLINYIERKNDTKKNI